MGRSALHPKPPAPASHDPPGRDGADDDSPSDAPKGWHESSLDLETGLDAFESEWPDDVTIPGAFDP
jgi:hypothetical protein